MNPVTHLLISWVVANAGELNTPDWAIVTVGGGSEKGVSNRFHPVCVVLQAGRLIPLVVPFVGSSPCGLSSWSCHYLSPSTRKISASSARILLVFLVCLVRRNENRFF